MNRTSRIAAFLAGVGFVAVLAAVPDDYAEDSRYGEIRGSRTAASTLLGTADAEEILLDGNSNSLLVRWGTMVTFTGIGGNWACCWVMSTDDLTQPAVLAEPNAFYLTDAALAAGPGACFGGPDGAIVGEVPTYDNVYGTETNRRPGSRHGYCAVGEAGLDGDGIHRPCDENADCVSGSCVTQAAVDPATRRRVMNEKSGAMVLCSADTNSSYIWVSAKK